jgi:hypothetical protein
VRRWKSVFTMYFKPIRIERFKYCSRLFEWHHNIIVTKSMLEANPALTEEKVKRIGYRNLRAEGWSKPKLVLKSPTRTTCTVDVFTDNPFPLECQFLNSDWIREHMPENFLIAFPNRKQTLVMRSTGCRRGRFIC